MTDRNALADSLIEARRAGSIVTLADTPSSLDEPYAVLDAVMERYGEKIVGWKAAFTNDAAMEKMKTPEPAMGPLFESWVFRSGAAIATPDNCARLIESEYAFLLARDLPARDTAYSEDEVADAVASLHPTIEIAHSRVDGGFGIGASVLIADHCANFAFAYGDGLTDWRDFDLLGQQVTFSVDGEEIATGTGEAVMGNPVASLTWLVNKRSSRGGGVSAGQILTTGTCTGMQPVARSCSMVADFGPLGQCRLDCTD